MKNSIFARFAYFIFWHFTDVLVLSTTWNDQFCRCVDDVSIGWQMFNFVFLCSKRWFQFNSRIVRTHFPSMMTLNIWKMIAEMRSYIFRWRSGFRRRRVCLKLPNNRWQWTDKSPSKTCGNSSNKVTGQLDKCFLFTKTISQDEILYNTSEWNVIPIFTAFHARPP